MPTIVDGSVEILSKAGLGMAMFSLGMSSLTFHLLFKLRTSRTVENVFYFFITILIFKVKGVLGKNLSIIHV